MISCLLVSQNLTQREKEAEKMLQELGLSQNHSNVLWFDLGEKLGIEQVRNIQEFLSLKPYQGKNQAVVLLSAENLSLDAQNALLKTLEEAGENVSLILGASSEDQLLPTINSRCKIINLLQLRADTSEVGARFREDIEKLIKSSIEDRFKFVEKLEDKENFLHALTAHFRQQLIQNSSSSSKFIKDLVEAEKWAKQNVNIRAILEYLMLKMP